MATPYIVLEPWAVATWPRTLRQDADGEVERRCPRCGEWWPATTEFFRYRARSGVPLVSYCRACEVEWVRERRLDGHH